MSNFDNMDSYTFLDNVFSFEGAVSTEVNEEYCMPWRIQFKEKELFPVIKDRVGRFCSGVRLCFKTDSENIVIELSGLDEAEEADGPMLLDIFIDGEFNRQVKVMDLSPIKVEGLSSSLKGVEIWLKQNQSFKLKRIYVDNGATISKVLNKKKRWIHYGSSISQSNAASSPSKTWAAMTAQQLNQHLTNLGLSGECVFDPMIGMQISELPADYITLKLGINAYPGLQTKRMFAPCVIGLIKQIREKHPYTPMTVISPIYCGPRENEQGPCGLSLSEMREILEGIVNSFKGYGDTNIYYLSGLEILGEDNSQHLPDKLHPNAEAQYIIAENFIKKVFYRMPGIL